MGIGAWWCPTPSASSARGPIAPPPRDFRSRPTHTGRSGPPLDDRMARAWPAANPLPLYRMGREVGRQLLVHARRPWGERGLRSLRRQAGSASTTMSSSASSAKYGSPPPPSRSLAHVAELVPWRGELRAGVEHEAGDRRRRHEQRTGAPVVAQVRHGVHRHDLRPGASGGRVDAREAGVGVLAAEKRDVQQPVGRTSSTEQRAPGEEPRVLVATHAAGRSR